MKNKVLRSALLCLAVLTLAALMTVSLFAADLRSIIDLDLADVTKVYFKCETNKDFTRYEVGEEMTFTFTLYSDGEQISAPFFKYSIEGDDGSFSDGFADATSGTATLKTKLTKPGAVRIVAEIADFAKTVISDSKITKFEGGAIAGALDIETTFAEPLDFDAFWAEQLTLLDECDPDLFYLEQVESTNANFDTYIVKVNCIGDPSLVATNATWTAGVLSVPKNAEKDSLGFNLTFLGYGVYTATRTYKDGYITFAVNSHSIEQLQPGAYYDTDLGLKNYGWKDKENASPYTSYFRWMLLRDVQAVRFLQKYFGTEGGETTFGGLDISAWKGLWNESDIRVSGGSQGGFQALSVAALVPEVTLCEAGVPWMADVGSNTVSTRIHTNYRPAYAEGLRYFDSSFMAKRIKGNVVITAGMGDPTCPVYGVQAIYNNLKTDASIRFRQGQTHGQTNTYPIDFTHTKTANAIPQLGCEGFFIDGNVDAAYKSSFATAWEKLTARRVVFYDSLDDLLASDAVNGKNAIKIIASGDLEGEKSTVSEEIAAIESKIRGLDSYGVAIIGDISSLTTAHRAILTMASDAASSLHILALGEESISAEDMATNLSASVYDNQPSAICSFKIIGLDGKECESFIVNPDIEELSAYPIVTPYYEFKDSAVSTEYKTPTENGEDYGILKISGAGVSKEIKVYDAVKVSEYGNDAGAEWIILDGKLSIVGSGAIVDTAYDWNSAMEFVNEIVLSEGITALGDGAFDVPAGINVVLPYSLKTIDNNAFCGKTDFTLCAYSGTIGSNFAVDKNIAFEDLGVAGECGENVYWRYEDGVLYIFGTGDTLISGVSGYGKTDSAWAEYHSVITKAVVGENITTLGAVAFHNMKALTTIELTRNVKTIKQGAFEANSALNTIYYKGETPVVGTADISSITDFAAGYIFDGTSKFTKYILSDDLKGTIKAETFKASNRITEMTIPEGVTAINNLVFSGCSKLNTLTVLGKETSIATFAFANKTSSPTTNYIENVTIVAYEGSVAQDFAKTNLMKFRNIETGEEIDYASIEGETLLEGSLGDGISFAVVKNGEEYTLIISGEGEEIVTGITDASAASSLPYAAYSSLINKVIIRGGSSIGAYAFAGMENLRSVELHAYVSSFGDGVFAGCSSLSTIYITDTTAVSGHANLATVKSIGKECFMGTAIEAYSMSHAISEIPEGIFKDSALKKAVISKEITNIGAEAFSGCASLDDLTIYAERYSVSENAFYGISDNCTVTAYSETYGETLAKEKGYTFISLGTIIHTVEGEIASTYVNVTWVFDEWTGVLTITASDKFSWNESGSADTSGGWANVRNKVTEVVILGNAKKISGAAFKNMPNLTKITMPALVYQIDSQAFDGCTSLHTIQVAGAPYMEGVADLSNIAGNGRGGSCLSGGSNIFRNVPNIKALILNKVYSETYPLVASNIPSGIEKIYGATDYLEGYCEDNGIEFVPFGKASSTAYIKIEDGIMTAFGNGSVSGLGDASKYASNVTSLIVEDGITELADAAFSTLTALENAILPEEMSAIGSAFEGCDALKAIYVFEGSETEAILKESLISDKLKYVFRISTTEKQLLMGNSFTLEAVICQLYRGDKTVVWSSDNEGVATVDNGVITAVAVGEAVIRASFMDGKYTLSCTLIVSDIPKSADSFLIFEGYQVRTEKYNGLRSRFRVDLSELEKFEAQGYTVIEYGTLLASTKNLSKNGQELTISKNQNGIYKSHSYAVKVSIFENGNLCNKYDASVPGEIIYYCTVTNFSVNNYDVDVSIRGYAVVRDSEGNEYVLYSDYPNKAYRSVDLYQICVNLAAEGAIDTASCISYIDVMNFKKSKEPDIGDVEVTPDSVWN